MMNEVATAVMKLEDRVAKVEKACEEMPEMLNVAALVEIMPSGIKGIMFMTTDATTEDYDRLKQKIFAWAANEAAVQGGVGAGRRWTSDG
jgi:hypothetical protein